VKSSYFQQNENSERLNKIDCTRNAFDKMPTFRPTLLVAALLSLFLVAPPQVSAQPSNSCGTLIVKAVVNEGTRTSTKYCEANDFVTLENVIVPVFNSSFVPLSFLGFRKLRAEPGRKLKHPPPCSTLCDGLDKYTCYTNYGQCQRWAQQNCGSTCRRRKMQEQEEELSSTIIVLDEIFDQQDNDLVDVGDRALQFQFLSLSTFTSTITGAITGSGTTATTTPTTSYGTCGFTSTQCNQQKTLFSQTLMAKLGDVGSPCSAAVAASFTMQCLLIVQD
jgi:hypothetical protein